jgi:hypothetical protein
MNRYAISCFITSSKPKNEIYITAVIMLVMLHIALGNVTMVVYVCLSHCPCQCPSLRVCKCLCVRHVDVCFSPSLCVCVCMHTCASPYACVFHLMCLSLCFSVCQQHVFLYVCVCACVSFSAWLSPSSICVWERDCVCLYKRVCGFPSLCVHVSMPVSLSLSALVCASHPACNMFPFMHLWERVFLL